MSTVARFAPLSVLLLTACSSSDEPASPRPAAIPVAEGTSYGGELVLEGELGLSADGSATIAIVPRGEDAPILARSWDLGDPAWRAGDQERRLYFALDARDVWPGATGAIVDEMDLVARFDPDGNPATEELGSVRVRIPARTGAHDLAVEIPMRNPVAARSAAGDGR